VEALFETNLDNIPEESFLGEDEEGLEDLASPWEKLTATERNPMWNHDLVNTKAAWELSRGQGIIVGHPDSGYIPHFELDDDRVRHDLEGNFYDSTPGANNSDERGGNHGLGTATVLMSGIGQLSDTHFVIGVAPEAILVPMRITRKGAPIFFSRSGPRRVRNAIRHAIDKGCHIISMSLGGPFEKSLHEAIQEAVRKNIIVCAAAGNVVRFVVWPARYEEVIAVAACTAERKKWIHSSRGPHR
jgi:lambda repressor-like predicted transcriptional regulator